jgi:hypothetical protein
VIPSGSHAWMRVLTIDWTTSGVPANVTTGSAPFEAMKFRP